MLHWRDDQRQQDFVAWKNDAATPSGEGMAAS
jgi:hypothetical protein